MTNPTTFNLSKLRNLEAYDTFRVLLVEDQIAYAHLVSTILKDRFDCDIVHLSSLSEAREYLRTDAQFFIAICDLILPDSSNGGIIDLMNEFHIPVIAMTAAFTEESRQKVLNSNAVDYVLKESEVDIELICDLIIRIRKNRDISVLIMDDSATYRALSASIVKTQLLNIYTAKDGFEGMNLLEHHPEIKVVLVDYEMPRMDGFTFIKTVRTKYGKDRLVLIGVSASSDDRLTARFLKAGANDFIHKPLSHETLMCRINQNLDMIESLEAAKNMSYKDYLTGLYNRRYFFERAEQMTKLAKSKRQSLHYVMLDIDHFKRVNDTYGHDVGDAVIVSMASQLKKSFSGALVARLGGEEFAIVAEVPDHQAFIDALEKFRLRIESTPTQAFNATVPFTCSLGHVITHQLSIESALKVADENLYQAKNKGRNRLISSFL